jgi:hypothetical protein
MAELQAQLDVRNANLERLKNAPDRRPDLLDFEFTD